MYKHSQHPSLCNRLSLRLITALLSCFVLVGLARAQTGQESFRFGEVDLELLEQVKQQDKRFEDQGLVYRESQLNAYVARSTSIRVCWPAWRTRRNWSACWRTRSFMCVIAIPI
jgi:hypothetical protein